MDPLKQYIDLYAEHSAALCLHAPKPLNSARPDALRVLEHSRLPRKGDEDYPVVSVADLFAPDYGLNINRIPYAANPEETFRCGVPNISTLLALVVNDTFHATASLKRCLPEGVIVTSLAQAATEMPQLVVKYYNVLAANSDAVAALNTLLVQDGMLVYVPKGMHLEKPLQLVNIFNAGVPTMGVRRILVVIDDDASASLLLCDHSVGDQIPYLSCQVAELFVGRNAKLDYYDLEESSARTSRVAQLYASQAEGSSLTVNGTTLIGGATRNSYRISHTGEHIETRLAGMVVGADSQLIENFTCIEHSQPKCHSEQMFKYILDQQAQGAFYGTIVVDEQAKFTNAYQSNKNILASTDAKMYTRPQLEIYCDEVKCSHGATVGQLDANAMFYMRSRGIPEAEAKMMLMQAFMADVIDTVTIPALKARLQQLTEMRLSGRHQLCADCHM